MEIKQVIVVRKDLKMRCGKSCSQSSHASMAFLLNLMSRGESLNKLQQEWVNTGQTKICVYVESEQDLVEIYKKAISLNITANLITDSGKTEFNNVPTKTCIAIGPDESVKIDKVTGHLKLL